MLTTKRKPAMVGEILVEEFMRSMGLTQAALAEAMGVQRKHVNELCNNRRNVTAATRTHPRSRVRQQPGFLAERAAAHRSVGGDEQSPRARADRTREAAGRGGVISVTL
jgi:addiction module HigA family antidote